MEEIEDDEIVEEKVRMLEKEGEEEAVPFLNTTSFAILVFAFFSLFNPSSPFLVQ